MNDVIAIVGGFALLLLMYLGLWLTFSRRDTKPRTSRDLEKRFHVLKTKQDRSRERSAF